MTFPKPGADLLDSRDVICHIDILKRSLEDAEPDQRDEINKQLIPLLALSEEGDGAEDWEHGVHLIHDSYFEHYTQDFAESIGAIDRNAWWPINCIDWNWAAAKLQVSYTPVEYAGHIYWCGNTRQPNLKGIR